MVKFWMVYVPDGVSPPKKQYFSRSHAEKDAKKLSRIHGKSAYVLQTASCWRPIIENVTEFEEPNGNQVETEGDAFTPPALGPGMLNTFPGTMGRRA